MQGNNGVMKKSVWDCDIFEVQISGKHNAYHRCLGELGVTDTKSARHAARGKHEMSNETVSRLSLRVWVVGYLFFDRE